MTQATTIPETGISSHLEPINQRILMVSEDQLRGFQKSPITVISERSGVSTETVIERIQIMLRAGTIRRVRQTLLSTSLAPGALVAWRVPAEKLNKAFDFFVKQDPFSGHVVVRSTEFVGPGSTFQLWTTLKVPQGYSTDKHCQHLMKKIGADAYRAMPAKGIFVLGVGHSRRRQMVPGERADETASMMRVQVTELDVEEWRVLKVLKREFTPEEITVDLWRSRADQLGISLENFFSVAERLQAKGVIGRFSTFLEHVKPLGEGERVTRFNALFHWAVPDGMEEQAGREVGRHLVLTHCYWREGGPEFNNVKIMAVAHGMEKESVLAHKAAMDEHLRQAGVPILYTNVFWGGRSEIKPSEIYPDEYALWCQGQGIDPASMKA